VAEEESELFYPETLAAIGDYVFQQGVTVEAHSSKSSYFDWAKVRFTKQFEDVISIDKMEQASIRMGYDGVFDEVFQGYVANTYNGAAPNEILLKDAAILLETTTINHTFLNTTPQEVIRFLLAQAGVTDYQLSAKEYPQKARVVIANKSGIQTINEIHSAWEIKRTWFFAGGVFYWGMRPEQDQIYSFEYAVNIISLNRAGGLWELETVSAPFIRHSDKITVTHPKVTGKFEVQKITFLTNESGFVRTYIYF
jgi:hypothetical protein